MTESDRSQVEPWTWRENCQLLLAGPVLFFSNTLIRYYKALDKLRAYETVHSDALATQLTSRAHVCMCFRSDEATFLTAYPQAKHGHAALLHVITNGTRRESGTVTAAQLSTSYLTRRVAPPLMSFLTRFRHSCDSSLCSCDHPSRFRLLIRAP